MIGQPEAGHDVDEARFFEGHKQLPRALQMLGLVGGGLVGLLHEVDELLVAVAALPLGDGPLQQLQQETQQQQQLQQQNKLLQKQQQQHHKQMHLRKQKQQQLYTLIIGNIRLSTNSEITRCSIISNNSITINIS